MIKVLYLTAESGTPIGSAYSLIDLIHSVQGNVIPIVVVRSQSAVDFFQDHGCKTYVVDYPLDITSQKGLKLIISFLPRLLRDIIVYIISLYKLSRICKKENIDIIHSNNSVLDIGFFLSKIVGKPHLWHLRELMDLDFGWKPLLGWHYLFKCLKFSDATLSITSAVKDHYRLNGIKNAYQISDAVRSINDVCLDTCKEKYFMMCGNLSETKGVDFAVRAFGIFNSRIKGYRLRLVGAIKDDYKLYILDIAKEYGIANEIVFEGYQKNPKPFYAKASGYLMCSKYEALGRVTIEAMFYGCPVIGRNSGGTKEIIEDGRTGFLFNTEEECADRMEKVVRDDSIIDIIRNAQEKAKSDFSLESYGKKIIEIYNNLLS